MFHKKKYFKQLKYIITGDCKTSVVYDQGCFPEAKSIFHDIHKPTNIPVCYLYYENEQENICACSSRKKISVKNVPLLWFHRQLENTPRLVEFKKCFPHNF